MPIDRTGRDRSQRDAPALARQPESRMNLPDLVDLADENARGEIARGRQIEPAVDRHARRSAAARLPHPPDRWRHEPRLGRHALVEHQIAVAASAAGMRLAFFAIARTSSAFWKSPNAGLAAMIASSENGSRSGDAVYNRITVCGSCRASASSISMLSRSPSCGDCVLMMTLSGC